MGSRCPGKPVRTWSHRGSTSTHSTTIWTRRRAARPLTAVTMEVPPVMVESQHSNASAAADASASASTAPANVEEPTVASGTVAANNSTPSEPAAVAKAPKPPRSTRLQPRKRRRKPRLLHLMQAWSVSLMVHIGILSALAVATFSSSDTTKKTVQLDSALVVLSQRRAGIDADLRRPGHPEA